MNHNFEIAGAVSQDLPPPDRRASMFTKAAASTSVSPTRAVLREVISFDSSCPKANLPSENIEVTIVRMDPCDKVVPYESRSSKRKLLLLDPKGNLLRKGEILARKTSTNALSETKKDRFSFTN